MQPKGDTEAYRRSQSVISSTEAPQFVGAGEGTDDQDFLADLSTLEVIHPDSKGSKEDLQQDEGLPLEVPIPLLHRLNAQEIPYAHCAWCASDFRVLKQLGEHYLSCHMTHKTYQHLIRLDNRTRSEKTRQQS